ncbi:MAG TPA: hypothetical protein VMT30_08330 [Candidatus Saccharimonadia bacterium]|nr:hypothetical protein [Candidatus Saccharimonadia bacterium]
MGKNGERNRLPLVGSDWLLPLVLDLAAVGLGVGAAAMIAIGGRAPLDVFGATWQSPHGHELELLAVATLFLAGSWWQEVGDTGADEAEEAE